MPRFERDISFNEPYDTLVVKQSSALTSNERFPVQLLTGGLSMPSKAWSDANREKCRESGRRHYVAHKERVKQWVRTRERRLREWLNDLKGQYRCPCGEDRVPCLDFHHRTGDKTINIGHCIDRGWGKKRILAEIAKCDAICANCHRYLHWVERNQQ